MTAKERGNELARLYLNGTPKVQEAILSFFEGKDREAFLMGVGLYHLANDPEFFAIAQQELGERVYRGLRDRKHQSEG